MTKTSNEKNKMKKITITILLSILPSLAFAGPRPAWFGPTTTFQPIEAELQINKIEPFHGGLVIEQF